MVIRVEYHIPKDYFLKHKRAFKKLLYTQTFQISVLKFEKGMTEVQIAEHFKLSVHKIRKILSSSCGKIRGYGFKI